MDKDDMRHDLHNEKTYSTACRHCGDTTHGLSQNELEAIGWTLTEIGEYCPIHYLLLPSDIAEYRGLTRRATELFMHKFDNRSYSSEQAWLAAESELDAFRSRRQY